MRQLSAWVAMFALVGVIGCGDSEQNDQGDKHLPPTPPTGGKWRTVSGDSRVSVRVCGLRVTSAAWVEGDEAEVPFNTFDRGVALALVATLRSGTIVEFDEDKSRIERFVDNLGADLTSGEMRMGDPGFSMLDKISPDGRHLLCEVRGAPPPAPGATSIAFEGSIAMTVSESGKPADQRLDDVELKKDFETGGGPIKLVVKNVGDAGWGDMKTQIELELTMTKPLAGVNFLDADGNVIESKRQGYMRSSFGGTATWNTTYGLASRPPKVTVIVSYWNDMTDVKVPVKFNVGLGLRSK
jgi:hypothetical protein